MADADRARKWAEERRLHDEMDTLMRLAGECSARFVAGADHAADCSSEFLAETIVRWCTAPPGADLGSEAELRKQAESYARRYAFRRQRRRRKLQLACETPGIERIASHEPGPEEIVQCADLLRQLLRRLPLLRPGQQALFVQVILDGRRLVDLEQETGRSADALGKAIKRTLVRLRTFLEGDALDAAEIEDYRCMLDEFHNQD